MSFHEFSWVFNAQLRTFNVSYIKLSMPKVSLATSQIAIFTWPSKGQALTKRNLLPEPEYQGMLERREMKKQHSSSLIQGVTSPSSTFPQNAFLTKYKYLTKYKMYPWQNTVGKMICASWKYVSAMTIVSTSNDFLFCPRKLWSKSFSCILGTYQCWR